MSTWSRLNSWASSASGRFSPFSHPTSPPTVTDSDFSYITNEDLAAQQNRVHPDSPSASSFSLASASTSNPNIMGANSSSSTSNTNQRHGSKSTTNRDTDILTFKHKKTPHTIHFPHSSIDDGTLSLADAKAAIARKLSTPPSRIRLFHAGRNLSTVDDRQQCRDVGLRSDASNDILVIVGSAAASDSGSDSEDDGEDDGVDGDADGCAAGDGKKRRKRKPRKKKSKTEKARAGLAGTDSSGTSTPTVEHLPTPSNLPSHRPSTIPAPRTPSPSAPQTPLAKLEAISHLLNTTLAPQAEAFIAGKTPGIEDPAKREFEYKRLSETILTQVVLKLDGVETEGDEAARARRRELVRESQGVLGRLDGAAKKS